MEELWNDYVRQRDDRGASARGVESSLGKGEALQSDAQQLVSQPANVSQRTGGAPPTSGGTQSNSSSNAQAGSSTNKAPSGAPPSGGGKPGDSSSSKPPPTGSIGGASSANDYGVIFVGVPKVFDHELVDIKVATLNDDQFFTDLRDEFYRVRTVLLNWFSVCTFSHCEFTEVCKVYST